MSHNWIKDSNKDHQLTVVSRPGWVHAWMCKAWEDTRHSVSSTFLLVYRSPLIKDTSAMYRPVADLILSAERSEVIEQSTHRDQSMMFGKAEALLMKLKIPQPRLTDAQLTSMIEKGLDCRIQ